MVSINRSSLDAIDNATSSSGDIFGALNSGKENGGIEAPTLSGEEKKNEEVSIDKSSSSLAKIRNGISNTSSLGSQHSAISKLASALNTDDPRITEVIEKVTSLMDSKSWRFDYFTKQSKTAIERYHHNKNDDSPEGKVAKDLRRLFINRVTMNLKVSRDSQRANQRDFLNPDRIPEGGERKVVEVINDNMRILYAKLPAPSPFLPRSFLFSEIVVDYEIGDGKKATLFCGTMTTHPSFPDPPNEVRMKRMLFADFYEELEVGDKPLTRWISLIAASGGDLPRILRPLAEILHNNKFETKVENTAAKYDRDDTNEQIIHLMEDENVKKLNLANTLMNLFTGSKLYLFVVSVAILFQIIYFATFLKMDQFYADKWSECMDVPEEN